MACSNEKRPSNIYDAETYSKRASSHYNEGKYDQAIADHSKAIEINPYWRAYNNRGLAYGDKGNYDQAIEEYNKAIENWPKASDAYYNRGNANFYKKEYEKAWDDVNKAQKLGYKVPPRFLKDLREASGRQQ